MSEIWANASRTGRYLLFRMIPELRVGRPTGVAALLLAVLVPAGGISAQSQSLRADRAQLTAPLSLAARRDPPVINHAFRREDSGVKKGALIGAGVGAGMTLLLGLMMNDAMDGGRIDADLFLVVAGGAAIGAFFGAAIGAGFD